MHHLYRGVVHRDIKPENIVTGRKAHQNQVFLVDFGISKFYKSEDGTHIDFQENKPFMGTMRYASIDAHRGYELSRKHDLESLGYVLIYLQTGNHSTAHYGNRVAPVAAHQV